MLSFGSMQTNFPSCNFHILYPSLLSQERMNLDLQRLSTQCTSLLFVLNSCAFNFVLFGCSTSYSDEKAQRWGFSLSLFSVTPALGGLDEGLSTNWVTRFARNKTSSKTGIFPIGKGDDRFQYLSSSVYQCFWKFRKTHPERFGSWQRETAVDFDYFPGTLCLVGGINFGQCNQLLGSSVIA